MGEVLRKTSVVQIVSQTLQVPSDTHPLARYMKLESLWILIELATGDEKDTQKLQQKEFKIEPILLDILKKSEDMHMVDLVYHLFCNILHDDRKYCKLLQHEYKIIDLMTTHMSKFLDELQGEKCEGYQTPLCKTLCCNILECLCYITRYEAVKMSKDVATRILAIAMAITLTYKTETPLLLCDDDVRTLFICKKIFFEVARCKKVRPSIVSNDFVIEFMLSYLDSFSRLIPDQFNQKIGLSSENEFACHKHVIGFINFMVELESHTLIMKFVKEKVIFKLAQFLMGE